MIHFAFAPVRNAIVKPKKAVKFNHLRYKDHGVTTLNELKRRCIRMGETNTIRKQNISTL